MQVRDTKRPVVTLEIPAAWFADPVDGDRHRMFYGSILSALAELGVLVDPVRLPRGAETAPRPSLAGNATISFHSYGVNGSGVLRCKEAYIPPYYSMDSLGYACFSHLAQHPEHYRDAINAQDRQKAADFVRSLAQELKLANRSKYQQPEHGEVVAQGYVFVPLQVARDTVSKGAWLQTGAALETIVETAMQTGRQVVIKRHPRCSGRQVTRLLTDLGRREAVVISDGSVLSLISGADLVVGANSGVLFESLIQGKPVISHAASDFGPATQQVKTCDELAEAVRNPSVPDQQWRDKFLYWYLTQYCVRADDVEAIGRKLGAFLDAHPGAVGQERASRRRFVRGLYRNSLVNRVKRRFF